MRVSALRMAFALWVLCLVLGGCHKIQQESAQPVAPERVSIQDPAKMLRPPKFAKRTPLGALYWVVREGQQGPHPRVWDEVTVHYSGWTTDGVLFDSSVERGRPATFRLRNLISGFADVLQRLRVGDKARLWIPESLAYVGQPGKPRGMLIFDVELLKIKTLPKPPKPPITPKDVAAPPSRARKTQSGLRYRLLRRGSGGTKPQATDAVTVHYSGWTTDGKLFDSSLTRGRPARFGLQAVIAGWTEGLQLMRVGDKVRFWMPERLCYRGQPGKPAGMLVFDVELLEIHKR